MSTTMTTDDALLRDRVAALEVKVARLEADLQPCQSPTAPAMAPRTAAERRAMLEPFIGSMTAEDAQIILDTVAYFDRVSMEPTP